MLLVDLGSVLVTALIAVLLLGWLYTFVKLKLIQYRVISLKDYSSVEAEEKPNKYKEAFDKGVVSALETVPSALAFFIKCTAYALTAIALVTLSLLTLSIMTVS